MLDIWDKIISLITFERIVSIIMLILTIIQVFGTKKKYDRERQANRKPFRSKAFIFMFILAIILIGFTIFITYKAYSKNTTRIVLLMPFDRNETSSPYVSAEKISSELLIWVFSKNSRKGIINRKIQ